MIRVIELPLPARESCGGCVGVRAGGSKGVGFRGNEGDTVEGQLVSARWLCDRGNSRNSVKADGARKGVV